MFLTSQRKGFSPECWSEWTFKDMLRLNDFPHVSQVNGMSLVWAGIGEEMDENGEETKRILRQVQTTDQVIYQHFQFESLDE